MGQPAAVLAVDGGNSKTDLALLAASGAVLAALRWGSTSHQVLGMDAAMASLRDAVAEVTTRAGLPAGEPVAEVGSFCLAGLDLPVDDRRLGAALDRAGFAARTLLHNDAFAVLRAGTDVGWGVAVVCGTGMNCVGVTADGREVRFPALGPISGDGPSGGQWLGLQALAMAVRATDGRGRPTALATDVPAHFGLVEPLEVTEAIYTEELSERRLAELAPVVFAGAQAGDEIASHLLDQLADELAVTAGAALTRLALVHVPTPVVLGGGIFRSGDPRFLDRVAAGIRTVAPAADVHVLDAPPVLGAALLGLDVLGAGSEAAATATRHLRSCAGGGR